MKPSRAFLASLVCAFVTALLAPACLAAPATIDWPLANGDLSSTRAAPSSAIDAANVATLHVAWRFHPPTRAGETGILTATPVVAAGVVYLQDMQSNVYALDLATGAVRWTHLFHDTNPGPDGVAVVGGRVYGATDTSAFALSAATGRLLWRHSLVSPEERYVDIAPQVAGGLVYVSTIGLPPNGYGSFYALSAATGKLRWRLSTIRARWRVPFDAGGGGAWYPPSVGGGTLYWGTTNPYPYGGSAKHPNGGAFAGPALYTDSLMAVGARTGKLQWYDQVTPHDVRDYDFQEPPVLVTVAGRSLVLGAGKAGMVIAWDSATRRRVWQATVGVHRNDHGALPLHRTSVCPGLLGGVETPMAYASGVLFVPVVDLCMLGGARGYEDLGHVDVARRGRGAFVALDAATGAPIWTRQLPQAVFGCATVANGVVFTSTFDGRLYGLDTTSGATLWSTRARAGINSCPSLSGSTLLVGAGIQRAGGVTGLTAYVVG